ncbi:MAG: TetR/AcrR family transcriptional regulator [Alphaproteobacteria bacterium]|nr:TetR/AcrR family transcriptional regulator [Alphaproteobacteria bacterium]
MPKPPDRRRERSRTALMRAFVRIVLTEGYEAVTVDRVADEADVGRSTFYMHYKGKEDILKASMAHPSAPLAAMVGGEVAPEALLPILQHFQEQRRVNRVFFDWPIRPIWVRCLAETIEPKVAAAARRGRPVLPVRLIALQIAEAQIALVAHWLTLSAGTKPEAVAVALVAETQALLAALLRLR